MNIYIEYTAKNWWHFGENYLYGNPYAKYLSILGSKKQKQVMVRVERGMDVDICLRQC